MPFRPAPAITALAAVLALLLISACGGDSDEAPTTPAQAEEGPAAPEEESMDDGSADDAPTDDPAEEVEPDVADADPEDVEVIEAWSDTLREGDVDAAAAYFALPSTAENGPQLLRIRDRRDAKLFNLSLPCGAVLVAARSEGDFTTATFELTERPGPGLCGPGAGE